MGFHEISHPADLELEIWADDLVTLFKAAAYGMASSIALEIDQSKKEIKEIEIKALDLESLLVRFLTELLFWIDIENQGFDKLDILISDLCLRGTVETGLIVRMKAEIKAVTWHNLKIQVDEKGYRVRIVFDL
jgi:SHS2 domain-containing protein